MRRTKSTKIHLVPMSWKGVVKIISGGQTGVDRAALDVALELGLPCGGWCPKGRRAEDGPLSSRYPLIETSSNDYETRTTWNVRDSDGTLILTRGALQGGTAFTEDVAHHIQKPLLVINLKLNPPFKTVLDFVAQNGIRTLNVAGPRESKDPGIYAITKKFLLQVLA